DVAAPQKVPAPQQAPAEVHEQEQGQSEGFPEFSWTPWPEPDRQEEAAPEEAAQPSEAVPDADEGDRWKDDISKY
ncbi:MAG: hypothetical protein LBD12_03475, partial [Clostridiales Family XIII bacterium]|nr:hypothetical protein [Clostridiales Family XIII bacterium]